MSEDAYIGKCKCGGIIYAAVVLPEIDETRTRTANDISDLIKKGFDVGRMKCEDVKDAKWCENHGKCK